MNRFSINAAACVLLIACIGVLVVLSGCQTSGKLLSAQKSIVCPKCGIETRTMPIKGMTYTKAMCPNCKKEFPIDPRLADTVRGYVGNEIEDSVHVCTQCQAMVETCPVCRKQMGMN